MIDTRRKDRIWVVTNNQQTSDCNSWDQLQLAVLMDLRDELKESKIIHKQIRDWIDSIRHFVHDLGGHKLRLLVTEHHRTAALKLARRRRARAAKRKASRAKRRP